jgi:hypothetical protein
MQDSLGAAGLGAAGLGAAGYAPPVLDACRFSQLVVKLVVKCVLMRRR